VTSPVSLLPPMTGSTLPPPSVQGLSDDEQRTMYYDGLQRMQNLGISVPPQLAGVRTVVDWPRICVDPLVQRCVLDGFRLPGATESTTSLRSIGRRTTWTRSCRWCSLDSLVAGRGYMIVGSPDVPGDSPLVTVESPLNLAMTWDPRTRR
jgi:hypothetical protein